MRARLYVQGDVALKSTLAGLPDEMQREIKRQMAEAGVRIKADARVRVPKLSRALHDSIDDQVSANGLTVEIGSRGESHAAFVEFGTRHRKRTPYLFPAFVQEARALRRELRKTVADLPRRVRTRITRHQKTRVVK